MVRDTASSVRECTPDAVSGVYVISRAVVRLIDKERLNPLSYTRSRRLKRSILDF
jgi:hypothetical protein